MERPNQVWCSDINYLLMRRGLLYLVAIMYWHTRKVLELASVSTGHLGIAMEA
ncbi:hypothetical protein [Roseivivax marinus]|uniref:hypothetical protein n=1 Tax=Roseivivax marinus TaxID=1379903 RepID=UPI001587697D